MKDLELEVLRLLAWAANIRNSQIASRLNIKDERVTRIIGRLKAAGLVEIRVKTVCPPMWAEDRRPASERTAKLTEAGMR